MQIYALLVAINEYGPVGNLTGALNDQAHYEDFLRANFPSDKLQIKKLNDSDATRANVVDGFREFLSRAKSDDVALFQYSGHGARWNSAPEFKRWFPDGFDEGLILYDSRRTSDAYDFADKELAILLNEVARNDPHLAVILDCCHSGSGTRSAADLNQLTSRSAHTVKSPRPLESYLDQYYLNKQKGNESLLPPSSRHLLMSGCNRYGVAFESEGRGIFSKTLLDAIDRVGLDVSYSDLFRRVRSIVRRHKTYGQSPQFEAMLGFNANQRFLSRLTSAGRRRFSVHYADWLGWYVNAGAINGISTEADAEINVELFEDENATEALAQGTSTEIGLNATKLDFGEAKVERAKVYSAEITSIPKPQLCVFLGGEEATVAKLLKTIEDSEVIAAAFEWDQETPRSLKYEVQATATGYKLNNLQNSTLIQEVQGIQPAAIEYLVGTINRIANWEHALHLQNPASQVDPQLVEFCYCKFNEDGTKTEFDAGDVVFNIKKTKTGWTDIDGEIQGRNTIDQRLHLMLVWFTEQFGVTVLYNAPHQADDGRFVFQLSVQDDIFERMGFCLNDDEGNSASHCLKLFVSDDQIDGFMVDQDPIAIGKTVSEFSSDKSRGGVFKKKLLKVSWFTKSININLIRNVSEIGNSESELAGGKIRVKPHAQFQSNATLVPPCEPTRSDNANHFVYGFRDAGLELINFSNTRGTNESVLELDGISNRESLEQIPLHLEIDYPLAEHEYLVPVAFDGVNLSLAGDAWKDDSGKTQIEISDLPEPVSTGRSVASTVKLYFFKALCGFDNVNRFYRYDIGDNGDLSRTSTGLGERINSANRILLLVHGLYGDTRSIAKEVNRVLKEIDSSDPPFDLIIGYDYETINTPIEEAAQQLKTLLKSKGIDENSTQKITVLGHSMGGLVARWFIEREQGNQIVDHLVLCGTPNEGSPFSSLAMAVRGVSNVASLAIDWMPSLIMGPIQAIQKSLKDRSLTTTLAQLSANSNFMQTLNTSDDPGIPYTVIAGDVAQYIAEMGRDKAPNFLTKVASTKKFNTLFGGNRNDIAVSTESARAILDSRSPAPQKIELPCHHLNYFLGEAGIACLKKIDWRLSEASEESHQ